MDKIWRCDCADGPLVATAIHAGAEVRYDVRSRMVLERSMRYREEDPFTGDWAFMAPTRVVGLRSRFEVDLNRPREQAVYRLPENCWGLKVYEDELPDSEIAKSLKEYDDFYAMLGELYKKQAETYGHFVVFDLHNYNYRRRGPRGPAAPVSDNPQVNIGTGTMQNRAQWGGIIDRFIHDLSVYDFPGGALDVRENVKFCGGEHPRWAHEKFSNSCCMLSVEVKKFFMDEWSGQPRMSLVKAVGDALESTVPGVLEELDKL